MGQTGAIDAGRDFSIFGLIAHADPIVQCVMLGLALASVTCWAIIFEKTIRLNRLSRDVNKLEKAATGGMLDAKAANRGMVRAVLTSAEIERVEGSARGETRNDVRSRLERAMRAAVKSELQRVETGLPFLATVGSAAPFVGLFGTVWGIMNSFTSIAQAKDTSLAVVAPGIAEALFATALGLVAAIPAVIAYNQITVSLGRSAARATTATTGLAKQIARSEGVA